MKGNMRGMEDRTGSLHGSLLYLSLVMKNGVCFPLVNAQEVVALYRELATTEGPRPDPSVHWMGASLAAFAADARATGYRHLPKEHHEEIVTGEVPERGEREAVFGDHRRSCGLRFLLETDMFFVGMKGAMIVTFALYVHDCFALATEMNPSN